jgi:hypothetical protein
MWQALEPPPLITDNIVQAMGTPIWAKWTFSTRSVANGVLLFSAWPDGIPLRHLCRTKDWRYSLVVQVRFSCCTVDGNARCMYCDVYKARFEPLLLIADAVVQTLALLWTFSTRAVADGALLFSAWPDTLLQLHCRIKDWRYSQAAAIFQVCIVFSPAADRVACCVLLVCCIGGKRSGGLCWVAAGALLSRYR